MMVMMCGNGYSWSLYAADGDIVFLVDNATEKTGMTRSQCKEIIRECRWMFGRQRVVYLEPDGVWTELTHDHAGRFTGIRPYVGFVPTNHQFDFAWEDPPDGRRARH